MRAPASLPPASAEGPSTTTALKPVVPKNIASMTETPSAGASLGRSASTVRIWLERALGVAAAIVLIALTIGDAQAEPETPHIAPPESFAEPAFEIAQADRTYFDGDAFRATFEGRTIHATLDGVYFGSEQYLSGDRTIWAPNGTDCIDGVWTFEPPNICFSYGFGQISCWAVFQSSDRIFAESVDGLLLEIVSITDEPLDCEPELLS